MKRVGIPSLQDLVLAHIVGSVGDEAMPYYLGAIPAPHIRDLISERWRCKKSAPAHSLTCVKRRLVSAEITVDYLEARELVSGAGILAQSKRRHTTPLIIDAESTGTLVEGMLSKLQLRLYRSKQHESVRFIVY